jgi:hypothetical protein
MSEGTEQFKIGRVDPIRQRSREIGSDASLIVGYSTVDVHCACGHQWTARAGNGLRGVVGGVHIDCPACAADGFVPSGSLSGK